MFKPLVSIVIPVYCGENYLAEAIDSALAQTYPNTEILVINDGSDDSGATERIALSYGDKIRYFHKINGGVSSALNMGIREMHGDFFSWLSHDDLYTPNKIANQIQILSERPHENREIVLMCSEELINSQGKKIFRPFTKCLHGEFTGIEIFKYCQRSFRLSLNGCGMLIPKSILDKVGFFDETLRYIQDYEYWYRIMIGGFSFICTIDKNVLGRVHEEQITARFPDMYYTENQIVANRLFNFFLDGREYREFWESYLCCCCKDLNPVAHEIIRRLKTERKYTLSLRLQTSFYFAMGLVRKLLKKGYHSICLKNAR